LLENAAGTGTAAAGISQPGFSGRNISFYPDARKETHENSAFLASKFRNHWKTPLPTARTHRIQNGSGIDLTLYLSIAGGGPSIDDFGKRRPSFVTIT
jgi:hypothetical protein